MALSSGDSHSWVPVTVGLILALSVALLTRLICPLPMVATPVIVEWLVKVPPLPFIKFETPVPITSVPVPASVALPDPTLKKVLLPVEASVMVPLLVIVPTSVVVVLLAIWRLPALVTPLSVLLLLTTAPLPAVVSVPPLMVGPLSVTLDPACALRVP